MTHTFFKRELDTLGQLAADVAVVSTRKPRHRFRCHEWTEELMARTTYLAPIRPAVLVDTVRVLLVAGPARWWRCWRAIASADDLSIKIKLRTMLLLPFAAELVSWARKNDVAHVHSHFCADGAHVAMFAHLLGGPTYSISLHGRLGANGGNQRNKWKHARFGIAVTRTLLAETRPLLGDSAPDTWGVAPMGVDTVLFRRETPYVPHDGSGPLRLFSCSRLDPGKAPDDLLRAVALLKEQGVDVHLRIAGEEDAGRTVFKPELEALVASLGISDRVELLGARSEQQVREELERAHIYALASLDEALGVATMEAMAMGVPAIATRVGGVPELLESGTHGILVEPRRPEQLADAVLRIARDPALAESFSRAGRQRVSEHFDTRKSASTLLSMFRETLESVPAAASGVAGAG